MAAASGVSPRTLQGFLATHTRDHQRAVDRVQEWVAQAHSGEEAIGLIDETSFPKHGDKTAGVQRPTGGATGKIDNYLVSAGRRERTDWTAHGLPCMGVWVTAADGVGQGDYARSSRSLKRSRRRNGSMPFGSAPAHMRTGRVMSTGAKKRQLHDSPCRRVPGAMPTLVVGMFPRMGKEHGQPA